MNRAPSISRTRHRCRPGPSHSSNSAWLTSSPQRPACGPEFRHDSKTDSIADPETHRSARRSTSERGAARHRHTAVTANHPSVPLAYESLRDQGCPSRGLPQNQNFTIEVAWMRQGNGQIAGIFIDLLSASRLPSSAPQWASYTTAQSRSFGSTSHCRATACDRRGREHRLWPDGDLSRRRFHRFVRLGSTRAAHGRACASGWRRFPSAWSKGRISSPMPSSTSSSMLRADHGTKLETIGSDHGGTRNRRISGTIDHSPHYSACAGNLGRFERIVGPMEGMCERLAITELPNVDSSPHVWFAHVLVTSGAMARMREPEGNSGLDCRNRGSPGTHRQGQMNRQLASCGRDIVRVPTRCRHLRA